MRDNLKPMLCHVAQGIPTSDDWAMEPKLDGWRFVFERTADQIKSYAGRNGADRTGEPADIERWLAKILPPGTAIDAELVAVGKNMISSDVATALVQDAPMVAYVFDILQVAGHDAHDAPYAQRRALLERLFETVPDDAPVKLVLSVPADQTVLDAWLNAGAEGVVLKRTTSRYRPGKRSYDWQKIKPTKTIDLRIVDLPHDGKGKFAGQVGAVVFEIKPGLHGRASGMTDAVRREMTDHPERYIGRIAEFAYQLQTRDGHLRHPVYKRLREDLELAQAA